MENVAFVDPVGAADAVSQIVATNVHPVIAGSFHFIPMSKAGIEVQDTLSEHRAAPVCAEDKLDLLADLRLAAERVAQDKQKHIEYLLSPHHHKLDAYDADIEAINGKAAELEAEVRQAALSLGGSIKGSKMQVVWAKGRTSYDTKALDAYAVANPQVLAFRKEGEPSVSIRAIGGTK